MTKQTKIEFNLKGLEDFQKKMGDQYRARVGILGANVGRPEGGDIDNATLGVIQMFGSITKNIPPRDFLLQPIQSHSRELVKALSASSVKAAIVAQDFKKVYALLGAKALEFVLMGFESAGFGQWAPNKPSTIARKGSDQPLIDTSQLRRAQTNDVVNRSDL